jgi:hypothetical protein
MTAIATTELISELETLCLSTAQRTIGFESVGEFTAKRAPTDNAIAGAN